MTGCVCAVHKYAPYMRTTLILNDELAAAAKQLAARRRTSLSGLVNEALRRALAEGEAARPSPAFSMPVFSPRRARRIDTPPAEFDVLLNDTSDSP